MSDYLTRAVTGSAILRGARHPESFAVKSMTPAIDEGLRAVGGAIWKELESGAVRVSCVSFERLKPLDEGKADASMPRVKRNTDCDQPIEGCVHFQASLTPDGWVASRVPRGSRGAPSKAERAEIEAEAADLRAAGFKVL